MKMADNFKNSTANRLPEPGSTEPGNSRSGSALRIAMRVVVSLALIGWIVTKIDWGEFLQALRNTHIGYLTLSLLLSPLLVLVTAMKWRILLWSKGSRQPMSYLFRLYLIGYFFLRISHYR